MKYGGRGSRRKEGGGMCSQKIRASTKGLTRSMIDAQEYRRSRRWKAEAFASKNTWASAEIPEKDMSKKAVCLDH